MAGPGALGTEGTPGMLPELPGQNSVATVTSALQRPLALAGPFAVENKAEGEGTFWLAEKHLVLESGRL